MFKIASLLLLALATASSQAQIQNNASENYFVLNGLSHHFQAAPKIMDSWNEENTGLAWQHVYSTAPYRYSTEVGVFKDSYGKQATYLTGAALHTIQDSPRISVGGMLGIAYRTRYVFNTYRQDPNGSPILGYSKKELTPIGGLVLQVAIPSTPIVVQTTFMPKVKQSVSGVLFGQMLVRF